MPKGQQQSKKTGSQAKKEDPGNPSYTWSELGSEFREQDKSLPNRLQLSSIWWANNCGLQRRYDRNIDYKESDKGVYRMTARLLDAAGYDFLQVARIPNDSDDSSKAKPGVVPEYGGLVHEKSKKRSFAIEPEFQAAKTSNVSAGEFHKGDLTGREQKAVREATKEQNDKEKGAYFADKTYPDLVVKRGGSKIAIDLKIATRYDNDTAEAAFKKMFAVKASDEKPGDVKVGPFEREFSRRRAIMGDDYTQRLLIDLHATEMDRVKALEHLKGLAEAHRDRLHFDEVQFVDYKGHTLELSDIYLTKDGFKSSRQESSIALDKHSASKGQTSINSFFQPGKTTRTGQQDVVVNTNRPEATQSTTTATTSSLSMGSTREPSANTQPAFTSAQGGGSAQSSSPSQSSADVLDQLLASSKSKEMERKRDRQPATSTSFASSSYQDGEAANKRQATAVAANPQQPVPKPAVQTHKPEQTVASSTSGADPGQVVPKTTSFSTKRH
ncbi:hypothetical protein [Dyella sp.]|uniref:hypothetical protein n=1 Tax=Dyella sp. TaxID=1869338 RepID=UPI002ED524D0